MASSAAGKRTKAEKITELTDAIGMSMLRARASPIPQVVEVMTSMLEAQQKIQQQPSTVIDYALSHLSVEQLKSLQIACGNGNTAHKAVVISKALFQTHFSAIAETEKHFRMAEEFLKCMSELMLLSQLGEEDGSISWNKLSKSIMNTIEQKSRQDSASSTAPPAGLMG